MIILVSKITDIFNKLDLGKAKKIAFIPNAKDNHIDKSGLEKTRLFFREKGFTVNDIDLNHFKDKELYKELLKYEIIFIAGGNCFVLLEKIKKSGFDIILNKLLDKQVIIIGESAGACVMGKSIEPLKFMDKPELAKLNNYNGLEFIDFVFVPHYNDPKYAQSIKQIEKIYGKKFDLKEFTDGEGIIMENNKIRKI